MRIIVHTALWKRPQVSEIFFTQLHKVAAEAAEHSIDIKCLAVVSTPEDKALAEKHKAIVVEAPNSPLGSKLNAGLEALRRRKFDYVLSVGSDDIFNLQYVLNLLDHAKKGVGVVGSLDIWFWCKSTQRVIYWKGYTNHRMGESVGAGRLTSKEALKALDFKLWANHRNKSVDHEMTKKLKKAGIKTVVFSSLKQGGRLVDIKAELNLTAVWKFKGISCRKTNFFQKHFDLELYKALQAL